MIIIEYSIGTFGEEQEIVESSIFARISQEKLFKEPPSADFDGNGIVEFPDFFLFAKAFGNRAKDENAPFDLDEDGFVGYTDLFLFADEFGKTIGKVVVGEPLPKVDGELQLQAGSTKAGLELVLRSVDLPLRSYGVVVEYDAAAFRLVEVEDEQNVLRASGGGVLLLTLEDEAGQVTIGSSQTGVGGGAEGWLAALHFEPLTPEARGFFRIRDAVVEQVGGELVQPRRLGQLEARWAPRAFALHANYPNPFNPSTAIRYQLAAASQVRLELYDVLGQKVRTLVHEVQPAGYYQVAWDSLNEAGAPVAAGVYFYRLQAGDFTQVRKLLLLK